MIPGGQAIPLSFYYLNKNFRSIVVAHRHVPAMPQMIVFMINRAAGLQCDFWL
jgi:hypothetical protein